MLVAGRPIVGWEVTHREAMQRTGIQLRLVATSCFLQGVLEPCNVLRSHALILIGVPKIKLRGDSVNEMMGTVGRGGGQSAAVKARSARDALGVISGRAHHHAAAHTVAG